MSTIPSALIERPQWVTWRYENGTKVPYSAKTGHKASSTKESTWTTYDIASKVAQARDYAGVGFVFSDDDPFTGIDLDDCRDDAGEIALWALEIVNDMMSYTEVSPSGRGLKIWVEGSVPSAVKVPYETGKVEIYSTARYFTVTGQHLAGTPTDIRNANGSLTRLYERLKPAPEAPRLASKAQDADAHTEAWARRKLAKAIEMVTLSVDGHKDDTLLAAARLAAGAMPYVSESEIETALYSAIAGRATDARHAQQTIRNGIKYGEAQPLPVPPPPPTPLYDEHGVAHCPIHNVRLPRAKNGNGYKCRERDASTPSGWCAFWWAGEGYIEPKANESVDGSAAAPIIAPMTRTGVSAPRFVLYHLGDLARIPPVEWLIPHEVPAGLFTVLCGPSEAGKSFLGIHYAMTIARMHPGRLVVYVAPEGGSGYLKRCEAWLAQHGGKQPQNLVFVLRSVPILDAMAVAEFIATIRHHNPVFVILDTLARCIVGGDENSAKDVGVFVLGCDTIRQETGAAVMVVHHTGKAGGYRGSSALFGAADSWIDFANDDGFITVSCGKAKDWRPFEPRYLRMVEQAESVVLLPADKVGKQSGLTEGQRKVLETLALDVFQGPGAKQTQIANATGINEKTLYRILSRLKREEMISQGRRGDPYTITRSGMDAIKDYHRALRASRTDELSPDIALPNAQVPQLSPNSHVLSATSSPILTHSHPPFIGGEMRIESEGSGASTNDEDLFPTPPAGFNPDFVRKALATGNIAAVLMHYRIHRTAETRAMDNGAVIDLANEECGDE